MSRNERQLAEVRLFTLGGCGACPAAIRVLRQRGIEFEEVRGELIPEFRRQLRELTGNHTVPQILIDGEPIGGADSLIALDHLGVLVPRVRRDPFPVAVTRRRFSAVRLVTGLVEAIRGRGHGPWRYDVRLVERDGRIIGRTKAGTNEEATRLAEALRGEFTTGAAARS